jgi:hypothetical protein
MDPFHFIKNIKQLLRLLQYLKGRKKSKLYIHTTKVSDDFLLFSKKLEVESKIKFFTKLNKKKRKFFSAAYLYLKEEFFMPNSIKKIFEKDFLLICSINSNFEKTRNNFYKFYIQIDEIKKMIFLFSLLNILHRK